MIDHDEQSWIIHELSWIVIKLHELSWIIRGKKRIVMICDEFSWFYMHYHKSSKIIKNCYEKLGIVMNFHELSWYVMNHIMNVMSSCCVVINNHEFVWIAINAHQWSRIFIKLSWTVMNCHELSWVIMNCLENLSGNFILFHDS